jgi:hypothetical protein
MLILRTGKADGVLREIEALRIAAHADVVEQCRRFEIDPPEFVAREELSAVQVRFLGLGQAPIADLQAVTMVHADADVSEGVERLQQRQRELRDAQRAFVIEAVAEVVGLQEEVNGQPSALAVGSPTGGLTQADVDVLDAAGLVDVLVELALWWSRLPSAKKKRCGAPQP